MVRNYGIKYIVCWLVVCTLFIYIPLQAQPQLQVALSNKAAYSGDTLVLTWRVPEWEQAGRNGVMHVWIQDRDTRHTWKLRFPVLKGSGKATLIVDSALPGEQYAVYCQLHNQLFYLTATLKENYRKPAMQYTMVMQNDDIISGEVPMENQRKFWLGKMIFEGKATIYFTPEGKTKINYVNAEIVTPLDSAFTPLADTTLYFTVGNGDYGPAFQVNEDFFTGKNYGTLADVEVKAQKKDEVTNFEETMTTGAFRSGNALVFNGLNQEMARFVSVFDFLRGRVPGLQFTRGAFPGGFNVDWRGLEPAFFLNETPVTKETLAVVSTADIALVKIFKPPFEGAFLGGAGGAIAVYTKSGGTTFMQANEMANKFEVLGYTPAVYRLRVLQL